MSAHGPGLCWNSPGRRGPGMRLSTGPAWPTAWVARCPAAEAAPRGSLHRPWVPGVFSSTSLSVSPCRLSLLPEGSVGLSTGGQGREVLLAGRFPHTWAWHTASRWASPSSCAAAWVATQPGGRRCWSQSCRSTGKAWGDPSAIPQVRKWNFYVPFLGGGGHFGHLPPHLLRGRA